MFSILIPTYNNLEYLKICINSIKKNSKFKHQIIVHVNEGSDKTIEYLKKNNLDFTYSKKKYWNVFSIKYSFKISKIRLYFNLT